MLETAKSRKTARRTPLTTSSLLRNTGRRTERPATFVPKPARLLTLGDSRGVVCMRQHARAGETCGANNSWGGLMTAFTIHSSKGGVVFFLRAPDDPITEVAVSTVKCVLLLGRCACRLSTFPCAERLPSPCPTSRRPRFGLAAAVSAAAGTSGGLQQACRAESRMLW